MGGAKMKTPPFYFYDITTLVLITSTLIYFTFIISGVLCYLSIHLQ